MGVSSPWPEGLRDMSDPAQIPSQSCPNPALLPVQTLPCSQSNRCPNPAPFPAHILPCSVPKSNLSQQDLDSTFPGWNPRWAARGQGGWMDHAPKAPEHPSPPGSPCEPSQASWESPLGKLRHRLACGRSCSEGPGGSGGRAVPCPGAWGSAVPVASAGPGAPSCRRLSGSPGSALPHTSAAAGRAGSAGLAGISGITGRPQHRPAGGSGAMAGPAAGTAPGP